MKTTTKIVGAVLGVLLVAALFTGAAAAGGDASDNATNLGNVEIWELKTADFFGDDITEEEYTTAEWEDALGNIVQFRAEKVGDTDYYFIGGDDIVVGKYFYTAIGDKEMYMINVKYPGVSAITGTVMEDTTTPVANLAGANVDVEKFTVQLDGFTDANASIAWTNPDGTLTTTNPKDNFGITVTANGAVTFKTGEKIDVKSLGEYTIQKVVAKDATEASGKYAAIAPYPLLGAPTTFTLYNSKDTMTLTALADEVIQGNYITLVLEAPKGDYKAIVEQGGVIPKGQTGVTDGGIVTVGLNGVKTFVVKSTTTDDLKVKVTDKIGEGDDEKLTKSITIKVVPGKISAEVVPAITNIGNEIDIIGTNELGDDLVLFMKGENYFKEIVADNAAEDRQVKALDKGISGKEFTVTLKTGDLKADAGYYTLYLAKLAETAESTAVIVDTDSFADKTKCSAYTTVSIKLVPSFISITEMPTYAVLGEDFVVKGTAEGKPTEVKYYVFGNNYYMHKTATVEDDNTFEITIKPNETIDVKTIEGVGLLTIKPMEAGQYFLVIQHPMYDGKFNVYPKVLDDSEGVEIKPADYYKIMQKKIATISGETDEVELFTVDERQTTNAAYALCKAIDGDEDVDDMYVKRSFSVVDKSSIINAIPGQVAQGDALVVSGTARGYKNAAVAVTISTGGAFDATSKNDAGEATGSFAEVTSVAADGSWSVNFDTANIPVGEYKVTVKVGTAATSEGKDLKVVKGSVIPQPTQTTGPQPTVQPTTAPTQTPASPGFGILAALAGLGAVAVLLLRRQ